jgi:aromatic ring-opening dioxygenase catalytic subunit (LigB family)
MVRAMLCSSAFLLPSVPTMLIDEQRGDYTEMLEALAFTAERLHAEQPDAIVAVSARWVSPGPFHADDQSRHGSVIDLPGWGVEPRYDCPGHPALARAIVESAQRLGVRAATARHGTDTGISIPLHFLARARQLPVVPLSIGEGTREEHRAWGAAIRHALNAWGERAAFVVGGALSFSQHDFNLRREVPDGVELDAQVLALIARGEWGGLAQLDRVRAARARLEAGLMHLEVMRGFLLVETPGEVLAYEASPGIGAALAAFALEHTGA